MLSQFGRSSCPHCETRLVHEFDLANDWVMPVAQGEQPDQSWLCPSCGYRHPVVYSVDRPVRPVDATLTGLERRAS